MTHSTALSAAAYRRLDELCSAWAGWYCDRWEDRPALEVTDLYEHARGPRRQWMPEHEVAEEYLVSVEEQVDQAIDQLPLEALRVLQAWAWRNNYNRGLIRKVEKTERGQRVTHQQPDLGRVVVNEWTLMEAYIALAPLLRRLNIVID